MRPNRATPELCPSPSRRSLLAGAGAALVAAPVVALPNLPNTGNPDAELLAAFARWKAAVETAEGLPDHWGDEPREPYWTKVWEAQDRLYDAPLPKTKAGIAAILSFLHLCFEGDYPNGIGAIGQGEPPKGSDGRARLLWRLIGSLKADDRLLWDIGA